ncbi:MAG: hypothetical protein WD794_17205 [Mycobacteriales bacterium]
MRTNFKLLGAVAVAGVVAASGSAFTAGNTVAASDAGFGTTVISPYATSDIQYNANSTDPENLDSVEFTLDKTARYVAMRTKDAGSWVRSDDLRLETGTVNSCTSAGGLGITWTCDVTGNGETVLAADNLTVVATS